MSIITKTINVGWSRPFEITILCVQILNRLSDHTLYEKHGILQNPIIEIYYWVVQRWTIKHMICICHDG